MISRPITVPAERSADLNAELCTSCSTMPGSSCSGLGEGGSAGGGAWVEGGAGCSQQGYDCAGCLCAAVPGTFAPAGKGRTYAPASDIA